MRRFELILAAVGALLFAVGLALLSFLAVEGKLGWAWDALWLHLDGTTTTPPERRLETEARALLQRGGDPEEIRALLERAAEIDPNSTAVYYLAEVDLREGDLAGAARRYEAFLFKDRTFLPAYLRLAEVYARLGETDKRDRLLDDGIAFFAANVDRFAPHPDPDVPAVFNEKAHATHNAYREALAILKRMKTGDIPLESNQ